MHWSPGASCWWTSTWYFLTPILFPITIVADRPREAFLLYLNPMTAVIVGYFARAKYDFEGAL